MSLCLPRRQSQMPRAIQAKVVETTFWIKSRLCLAVRKLGTGLHFYAKVYLLCYICFTRAILFSSLEQLCKGVILRFIGFSDQLFRYWRSILFQN